MTKEKSKYCNCLCHASNVLARNMTRMMDEELSVLNLTSSYAYLLLEVGDKNGINPKSLSKTLELAPSTVTRLIEKMEYRGVLRRDHVGRATEVYLTESGKELIDQIRECIRKFNERAAGLIGENKVQKLASSVYEAAMKIDKA